MIDDHPLMIEGYKSILSLNKMGYIFNFTDKNSAEEAFKIITKHYTINPFDIIFIDLILPEFKEKQIKSGEDVALLVKKQLPDSKIIIPTSQGEAFIIQEVISKINPDAFLVKNDCTAHNLLLAVQTVLQNKIYYSATVEIF